jgi:hypothetical protein
MRGALDSHATTKSSLAYIEGQVVLLALWFRSQHDAWIVSRARTHRTGVARLAALVQPFILGMLQPKQSNSSSAEASIEAVSLAGAIVSSLPAEMRLGLIASVAEFLARSSTLKAVLVDDNAGEVTVKLLTGVGDLVSYTEEATAMDPLLTSILSIWRENERLPTIHYCLATGLMFERATRSVVGMSATDPGAKSSFLLAAVATAVRTDAETDLAVQLVAMHAAAGLLNGFMLRHNGASISDLDAVTDILYTGISMAESYSGSDTSIKQRVKPKRPEKGSTKLVGRANEEAQRKRASDVRGIVGTAMAACCSQFIQRHIIHLENSGGPSQNSELITSVEPISRTFRLLSTVIMEDVLRVQWWVDQLQAAAIGDATAAAAFDEIQRLEMGTHLESIASALGKCFSCCGLDHGLRASGCRELCQNVQHAYDFTLNKQLMIYLSGVPGMQHVLQNTWRVVMRFCITALVPVWPFDASGDVDRLSVSRQTIFQRVTGEECAALVMAAVQIEFAKIDDTADHIQALSDAIAACFDGVNGHDTGDSTEDASSWQVKLLQTVPSHDELVIELSSTGADGTLDWRQDPAIINRAYLSLLMIGAQDILPQFPWPLVEDRIVPVLFLLLQHRRPQLNERAQNMLAVVFETAAAEKVGEMAPRYLTLSLDSYPAITQSAGLGNALKILARTLSYDPAKLKWAVDQVRSRLDALVDAAALDGQLAGKVTELFEIYSKLLLNVELNCIPLVRLAIEDWFESTAKPGNPANPQLLDAIYNTIFETFDFTRKFELSRWFMGVRLKHAENSDLPERESSGPPGGPLMSPAAGRSRL